MKTLFAAAGTSDVLGNDVPDGTSLDISDGDCAGFSTASNIISTITTCAQKLDENDIPEDDRFIILTPANYYKLVSANSDAVSFTTSTGGVTGAGYSRLENPLLSTGQVSLADAKVAQVAGISVIKSNHLADVIAEGDKSSTATGDGASSNDVNVGAGVGYNANFTGLEGLAGHKSAIGTVKLMDLTTESEYIMTKQGTALVAKYAMGHGVLRPEAAIKIVA